MLSATPHKSSTSMLPLSIVLSSKTQTPIANHPNTSQSIHAIISLMPPLCPLAWCEYNNGHDIELDMFIFVGKTAITIQKGTREHFSSIVLNQRVRYLIKMIPDLVVYDDDDGGGQVE